MMAMTSDERQESGEFATLNANGMVRVSKSKGCSVHFGWNETVTEQKMMSFDSEMTMAAPTKKLTLRSSDGETFEVDMAVVLESQTIKHMVEDDCVDNVIPLPNVTSSILAKVIEYCKRHVKESLSSKDNLKDDFNDNKTAVKEDDIKTAVKEDDIKAWDTDFVKVDQNTLFDLILAANYLHIKNLLDLTCQTVADMIKGKTPEEIRRTFDIRNDFTPEEEEQVRRENQWAFE